MIIHLSHGARVVSVAGGDAHLHSLPDPLDHMGLVSARSDEEPYERNYK